MKVSKYTFLVADQKEINHRRIINENPFEDAIIVITGSWCSIFIKDWLYHQWYVDGVDVADFHAAIDHKWNDSFYYGEDIERRDIQHYVELISFYMKMMKKRQPVKVKTSFKREVVHVLGFDAEQH
jgi:hypothetical protein